MRALSTRLMSFRSEKVMKTGNPVMLGLWQACLFTPQITCTHFIQPAVITSSEETDLKKKKRRKTIACVNASGAFTSWLNEVGYLDEVGYFQSSAMRPPHVHIRHTRWCQYAPKYSSNVTNHQCTIQTFVDHISLYQVLFLRFF